MRRTEIGLVLALTGVIAGAAILGQVSAPRGQETDFRLSTRLTGPHGASAFRAALGKLGVDVTERLHPLFDLEHQKAPDRHVMLAILDPVGPPTLEERRIARDWVVRGGQILTVGSSGIEECFGYSIEGDQQPPRWLPDRGTDYDTDDPPKPRAFVYRGSTRDDAEQNVTPRERCETAEPVTRERIWVSNKRAAAIKLTFASGGTAIIVGDASVFTNRPLRHTGAGPLVIGWILGNSTRALIVDEYHQGFGRSGSLSGAVIAWASAAPAGWMIWQLVAAGLLGLALAAVRFGPPIPAIERRRRSPLEHLDALAAGLERSGAASTAIRLIVNGLRRRLGGTALRTADADRSWLETLETGARSPEARQAAARVRSLMRADASSKDVQLAANAVEDVWETLKGRTQTRS